MYITYAEYIGFYDPIDETVFNRLAMEASRVMDKFTTGIDNYRKLKNAYPEDAEAVTYTAAQLVNFLYQCYEAEQSAALGRGYTETEQGVKGKVISSVSAGNESISYTTATAVTTAVDNAVKDKSTKDKIMAEIVRDGLSGVTDANGVNLLYMGAYPRRYLDV